MFADDHHLQRNVSWIHRPFSYELGHNLPFLLLSGSTLGLVG